MSQEVDPGPPIGLPFDQFQPVDKTLRRPVTPDERQPGAHGRFILEQPLDEATQLLHASLLHHRDPGIKIVTSTVTDHAAEGLDLVRGGCHDGIQTEEMRQEGPISWTLILLWSAEITINEKMAATVLWPIDALPAQSAQPPGLRPGLDLPRDSVLGPHTRLSAPACPDRLGH